MDRTYLIVTPVYNAEKWISQCINSVKTQRYQNFKHIIVDDCSSDGTLDIIKKEISGDDRFVARSKSERHGVLHSHVIGAEILGSEARDQDVYVHLDGDDWLVNENALDIVDKAYRKEDCWATYGNYETTDGSPSVCKDKMKDVSYREHILHGWPFSHLRTFKKFLWDRIQIPDLFDSQGKVFSSAADVAIMCPILEMANRRVHFIKDTLYVYNRDNPLNEDRDHLQDQVRCAMEIVNKKSYEATTDISNS